MRTKLLGNKVGYIFAVIKTFINRRRPRKKEATIKTHQPRCEPQLPPPPPPTFVRGLNVYPKSRHQACRYDPLRKDEYLAACRSGGGGGGASTNGGTDSEQLGGFHTQRQQGEGEGGEGEISAGGGDGCGRTINSSAPPFARLRERTFDMTRRGELTSANVWYALRKDREAPGNAAGAGCSAASVGTVAGVCGGGREGRSGGGREVVGEGQGGGGGGGSSGGRGDSGGEDGGDGRREGAVEGGDGGGEGVVAVDGVATKIPS